MKISEYITAVCSEIKDGCESGGALCPSNINMLLQIGSGGEVAGEREGVRASVLMTIYLLPNVRDQVSPPASGATSCDSKNRDRSAEGMGISCIAPLALFWFFIMAVNFVICGSSYGVEVPHHGSDSIFGEISFIENRYELHHVNDVRINRIVGDVVTSFGKSLPMFGCLLPILDCGLHDDLPQMSSLFAPLNETRGKDGSSDASNGTNSGSDKGGNGWVEWHSLIVFWIFFFVSYVLASGATAWWMTR